MARREMPYWIINLVEAISVGFRTAKNGAWVLAIRDAGLLGRLRERCNKRNAHVTGLKYEG
jgi:hypothetical protein